MTNKQHRNALKPGHRIHWYEIKQILGQGGFGITYLAFDPNLEKHVAIKEYLPAGIAVREGNESVHPVSDDHGSSYEWGLERFIAEARTLSKFKHPNIVHVLSVTEENNTAYMVMEYEDGESLQTILKQQKTIPEHQVLQILMPILDGLEIVHRTGFIHRDIKPANIYIRKDGSPVLLDFGSARQALGEETKTLTTLISPGYAPFEQYFSSSSEQGEWSDIYALGATFYRAVTGIAPHEAVDRSNAILKTNSDTIVSAMEIASGKYAKHLLEAIDHALAFRIEDRPQSIAAWREEITTEPPATIRVKPVTKKVDPQAETVPGTEALQRIQSQATPPPAAVSVRIDPHTETLAGTVELPRMQAKETPPPTPPPEKKKGFRKRWLFVPLLALGVFIMLLFVSEKKKAGLQAELSTETSAPVPMSGSMPTPAAVTERPAPTEAETISNNDKPAASKQQQDTAQEPEPIAEQAKPAVSSEVSTRRLLQDARYHMNAGRLFTPPGLNAYEKYKQVLKRDPDNREAKQGMEKIARTVLGDARTAANNREYNKAEEKLKTLRKLFPQSEQLNDLLKRIKRIIREKEMLDLEKEQLNL